MCINTCYTLHKIILCRKKILGAMSSSLLRLAVVNNNDLDVQRILHHYSAKPLHHYRPALYETTMLHEACRAGSREVIDSLLTLSRVDINKLEPKLMVM